MAFGPDLEQLLAAARLLPPMTAEERERQSLSFAYGNLACSTHHKPTRKAFRSVALDELGWSEEKFDVWASDKEWCEEITAVQAVQVKMADGSFKTHTIRPVDVPSFADYDEPTDD